MDYQSFVNENKSLLIAPAGYGKTYTIVECLNYTTGRQLILTHTHAGVAAIKEKIKEAKIKSDQYSIETISSFAQKYVSAFYMGDDVPDQDDSKNYHPFLIEKAQRLFQSTIIKRIIKLTYAGLFVDEYQDCTKSQHRMILALSESLPTHVLGDPLQGIFNFNGDLVEFTEDLKEFCSFPELNTPYRWYKEGNKRELGDLLKRIRTALRACEDIDLELEKSTSGFYFYPVQKSDLTNKESSYRAILNKIITNPNKRPELNSLLVIIPEKYKNFEKGRPFQKGNIEDRTRLRNMISFDKSLTLLEAIDDKNFYSLAKKIDNIHRSIKTAHEPIKKINDEILKKIFLKKNINSWFNDKDVKDKRDPNDKRKAIVLKDVIMQYISQPTSNNMKFIFLELKNNLKVGTPREGLYYSILNALEQSESDGASVYEAMKTQRNVIRRSGRKIYGKCIGTTLLTKGLEFDTVVILDADKFTDPKNFYVAITRCCKKLIIFSSEKILSPYP